MILEAGAAFGSSLLLMLAYYVARRAWRRFTYVKPSQRGIDPIGEAEVFLAYGKVDEAIRVLRDTVKDEPDNLSAKITLLRAYSYQRNHRDYSTLAHDVKHRLEGQPLWQTIQCEGKVMDPGNPLYQS